MFKNYPKTIFIWIHFSCLYNSNHFRNNFIYNMWYYFLFKFFIRFAMVVEIWRLILISFLNFTNLFSDNNGTTDNSLHGQTLLNTTETENTGTTVNKDNSLGGQTIFNKPETESKWIRYVMFGIFGLAGLLFFISLIYIFTHQQISRQTVAGAT